MADSQYTDKFKLPERFLSELIVKSARGQLVEQGTFPSFVRRAAVIAIDVVGGNLENPSGQGSVTHMIDGNDVKIPARVGPTNPPNAIKARIISEGFDQFYGDEDLRVFWPLFSDHLAIPVKVGEHVYVTFEDRDFLHGLWISRVSGHDDLNFVAGSSKYVSGNPDSTSNKFPDISQSKSEPDHTDKEAGDRLADGHGQSLTTRWPDTSGG